MNRHRISMLTCCCAGIALGGMMLGDGFAEDTLLVPMGAEWKFLDDGSDQGTAWRAPGFDDSAWSAGQAPLGAGSVGLTITPIAINITTYFRLSFEVDEATLADFEVLSIGLRRDDGAVVYLNGVEIHRDNMPAGPVTSETSAAGVTGGNDEEAFFPSIHLPDQLVPGTNVLAVEVHQRSISSDVVFDMVLLGQTIATGFGTSRPPSTIDFETVERRLLSSETGVAKFLNSSYTGIDYGYHSSSGTLTRRVSRDRVSNVPLPSTALAMGRQLDLGTGKIDLRNHTDVALSLDIRANEGADTIGSEIRTSISFSRDGVDFEEIPWSNFVTTFPRGESLRLFPEGAEIRYEVPTSASAQFSEVAMLDFDDSAFTAGTLGVGYGRSGDGFEQLLGTQLEDEMYNRNASVNIRIPFSLEGVDLADWEDLAFLIRYDDGFVAMLNGTEIARANAPESLLYDSEATLTHPDSQAVILELFETPGAFDLLNPGENVLTIRGLNRPATSSDMLIDPVLFLVKDRVGEPSDTSIEQFVDAFQTVTTQPGLIPDDAVTMVFRLEATNNAEDFSGLYFDNLTVTGSPIAPDSFPTAIELEPGLAGIDIVANPDPDDDSVNLLLEYAFVGSFLQSDERQALFPTVGYDQDGHMIVQFRMIGGFNSGSAEMGIDVADLRYTPQLSTDLIRWEDGRSSVAHFGQVGEPTENGDGSVTVSLRSFRSLRSMEENSYFRLHVEVARPPGVVLGGKP